MKNEIKKQAAALQHVFKFPRLTLALMALWVVFKAIEAVTGIENHPVISLILISALAVLALLFAYLSFEKI